MTGVTIVYLVQHGDKERLPGDPGLTALGRQQATRTGRWLSGRGVRALRTQPDAPRPGDRGLHRCGDRRWRCSPDARLRERLNWDGGMPLTPSWRWARTTRDRDLVPEGGQSSRQAASGC
jgi:hypothetical protein